MAKSARFYQHPNYRSLYIFLLFCYFSSFHFVIYNSLQSLDILWKPNFMSNRDSREWISDHLESCNFLEASRWVTWSASSEGKDGDAFCPGQAWGHFHFSPCCNLFTVMNQGLGSSSHLRELTFNFFRLFGMATCVPEVQSTFSLLRPQAGASAHPSQQVAPSRFSSLRGTSAGRPSGVPVSPYLSPPCPVLSSPSPDQSVLPPFHRF